MAKYIFSYRVPSDYAPGAGTPASGRPGSAAWARPWRTSATP